VITPLSDWLLVKVDPPSKRSGIIEIASDNDTSAVRTGTVLRMGPGKVLKKGGRSCVGLQIGDRVAFLRWHQEHRPGKSLKEAVQRNNPEIEDDLMLIREPDVLFAFDGDVSVDA
jgi:co-chaperonin GroES (HSP10)